MIQSYLPLYRKYRPQKFSDLVGQEALSHALGNAIELGKVAHAYLFCGPRGTGKTSTARIFAKSLNCVQGPTVDPCLACDSCTSITHGTALDVIEFDAASNNGVDDARELIESCQFAPMAGRYKVYIIDEVHMLTTQAFNALLKTLEEPPPNVVFVFATTEAHKVIPTIISRCQRFDLHRITTPAIVGRLRYIAEQEQIAIEEMALNEIARHARGGLRDAVGLLDQLGVIGRGQAGVAINRKDVLEFTGSTGEELLLSISESIAHRKASQLLLEIQQMVQHGLEPSQLVKDLAHHFRNLLLAKAAGPSLKPEVLDLEEEYFERLKAHAAVYAEEELPQILARLAAIEREMRQGQDPMIWLEIGLLGLAYRQDIHQVEALAARITQLEQKLSSVDSVAPVAMGSHTTPLMPPKNTSPAYSPLSMPSQRVQQPSSLMAAPPQHTNNPSVTETVPGNVPPLTTAPPSSDSASSPSLPPDQNFEHRGGQNLYALHEALCKAVANLPTRALAQQHTVILEANSARMVLGCASGDKILAMLQRPEKLLHLKKAAESLFGPSVEMELRLISKSQIPLSALPPSGPSALSSLNLLPEAAVQGSSPPLLSEARVSSVPPLQSASSFPAPPMPSPENLLTPTASVMPQAAFTVEAVSTSTPLSTEALPAGFEDEEPPEDLDLAMAMSFSENSSVEGASVNPLHHDQQNPLKSAVPKPPTLERSTVDPEMDEAKRYTMSLLQGRILD